MVQLYYNKYLRHPGKLHMPWMGPFLVVGIIELQYYCLSLMDFFNHHRNKTKDIIAIQDKDNIDLIGGPSTWKLKTSFYSAHLQLPWQNIKYKEWYFYLPIDSSSREQRHYKSPMHVTHASRFRFLIYLIHPSIICFEMLPGVSRFILRISYALSCSNKSF